MTVELKKIKDSNDKYLLSIDNEIVGSGLTIKEATDLYLFYSQINIKNEKRDNK